MSNISNKQQLCINSLLSGCTHLSAAKAAGVTPQSLSRWLRDVDFLSELTRQRGELTSRVQALVMARASAAVETLAELATGAEKDSDRIRAASAILSLAVGSIADAGHAAELAWLSARVDAAEKARADK